MGIGIDKHFFFSSYFPFFVLLARQNEMTKLKKNEVTKLWKSEV